MLFSAPIQGTEALPQGNILQIESHLIKLHTSLEDKPGKHKLLFMCITYIYL